MRFVFGAAVAARVVFGAAVATLLFAVPARAAWPDRPVRWIVPYPPGGATDIVARVVAAKLGPALGQQVVIDNRPGAGGNVGSEVAAKSPPDGYTLLLGGVAHAINATLQPKLPYDLHKDLVSVVTLNRLPNVMVVPPQSPWRTVPEFIAAARAAPGKLNFASSGNGTSLHLSGELFKLLSGVDMVHVPYRGAAPAIQDLVAGNVQVMFDNIPSAIGHVRGGTLRGIAVTTIERSPALPDLPTIAEAGVKDFEAYSWFNIMVPAGTPAPIIQQLNSATNAVLKTDEIREKLLELGATPAGGTSEQAGRFMLQEIDKWSKVVRAANLTVD
jgi:tripartite-type tricarboxylate transporter receptor subunit TctC